MISMILDILDATMPYIYNQIPITHDTLDIFQTKNPKNFYHLIFFNLNRYSRWKALLTPRLPFHFAKTQGVPLSFFHCFLHIPDLFTIAFYILMLIAGSSCFMRLYAVYFYFSYIYSSGPLTGPFTGPITLYMDQVR